MRCRFGYGWRQSTIVSPSACSVALWRGSVAWRPQHGSCLPAIPAMWFYPGGQKDVQAMSLEKRKPRWFIVCRPGIHISLYQSLAVAGAGGLLPLGSLPALLGPCTPHRHFPRTVPHGSHTAHLSTATLNAPTNCTPFTCSSHCCTPPHTPAHMHTLGCTAPTHRNASALSLPLLHSLSTSRIKHQDRGHENQQTSALAARICWHRHQ